MPKRRNQPAGRNEVPQSRFPAYLCPHHIRQLTEESAISSEVVNQRRYASINSLEEFKKYSFPKKQWQGPGLMIPLWGTGGKINEVLYRPDKPRKNSDGKTV